MRTNPTGQSAPVPSPGLKRSRFVDGAARSKLHDVPSKAHAGLGAGRKDRTDRRSSEAIRPDATRKQPVGVTHDSQGGSENAYPGSLTMSAT